MPKKKRLSIKVGDYDDMASYYAESEKRTGLTERSRQNMAYKKMMEKEGAKKPAPRAPRLPDTDVSTSGVRRAYEQSEGVMRNPGGFELEGLESYRKKRSKQRGK